MSVFYLIKYFRHFKSLEKKTREELDQLQSKALSSLLLTARAHRYYGQFLKGMTEDEISGDPYRILSKFPIISKKEINRHSCSFVPEHKENYYTTKTSGTTGEPLIIYFSPAEYFATRAIHLVWMSWAGHRIGQRILQSGNYPIRKGLKKIKDILLRTTYINSFDMSEKNLSSVVDDIGSGKYDFVGGYSTTLLNLLGVIQNGGHEPHYFKNKVKGIMSWAGMFDLETQAKIKEVFGVSPVDTYGCAEAILVAASMDGVYRTFPDHVIVEIVDEKGDPVKYGEQGEVVLTSLTNHTFPLIRYRLGDLAVKAKNTEEGLPVYIKEVQGRSSLSFKYRGKIVSQHTVNKLFFELEVTAYQLEYKRKERQFIMHVDTDSNNQKKVSEVVLGRVREYIGSDAVAFKFGPVRQPKNSKFNNIFIN